MNRLFDIILYTTLGLFFFSYVIIAEKRLESTVEQITQEHETELHELTASVELMNENQQKPALSQNQGIDSPKRRNRTQVDSLTIIIDSLKNKQNELVREKIVGYQITIREHQQMIQDLHERNKQLINEANRKDKLLEACEDKLKE